MTAVRRPPPLTRHSPFAIRHSPFAIRHSLFATPPSLPHNLYNQLAPSRSVVEIDKDDLLPGSQG